MNLTEASKQYFLRPDDERYNSLEEMHAEATRQRQISQSVRLPKQLLPSIGYDDEQRTMLLKTHEGGRDYVLGNWSFNQLCQRLHAPADYLLSLDDPHLEAACLNKNIRQVPDNAQGLQLYHQDGFLRAVTSHRYSRIYDCDILRRLLPLKGAGWKTPPAWGRANDPRARQATAADVSNYSLVKVGDWIKPSGLYRGDRDMFVFMVNDENRINDGTDLGLGRGFFVRNSEVGCASFSYTEFAYRYVCGNHIVWGAQDVREVRLRHIGRETPDLALQTLAVQLIEYANSSAREDELLIAKSKNFVLGDNKDDVLDFLFGKRLMSRKLAQEAYETCEEFEPALNPRSVWGIVQGVTRSSQQLSFANKRYEQDSVTPKLLQLVA